MELLIFLAALLVLGYSLGTIAEKAHFNSIKKREREFLNLPTVTIKNAVDTGAIVEDARLVSGSAVIALDYFKRFLAALRNIFGGEVRSYETLLDRARREAILRMKAMSRGADIILNVRIETSTIGLIDRRKKAIGCIEALAYGTAITLKNNEPEQAG